jgi:hypothetical protein
MGPVTLVSYSSRGRKTLVPNSYCLVAIPTTEKASEVNIENKSGAGVPKAVHR